MQERNWGGNLTYVATGLARPGDLDELRSVVLDAPLVKPLGTRHSFSPAADADGGLLVSLERMRRPPELDTARRRVRVSAATTYGELAPVLHAHGLALENLASLPHCTVAGTVATGTHGSGHQLRGLGSAVAACELLTADGTLLHLARGDEGFDGVVVGVGALGIVTSLTLDLVPATQMRQLVYEPLTWQALADQPDTVLDCARSVSVFTRWSGEHAGHVLVKDHADAPLPEQVAGARPADGPRHPVHTLGRTADGVTEQGGVPGPWYERLPHFRLEHTPSDGAEVQAEYFVDRAHGPAVVQALRPLGALMDPLLRVCELRTVAADELWLSPAQGRDTLALHFTWALDQPGVEAVLAQVEQALAPFEPRVHLGKLFVTDDPLRHQPRAADFAALRTRLDPNGRFLTGFVRRLLGDRLPG